MDVRIEKKEKKLAVSNKEKLLLLAVVGKREGEGRRKAMADETALYVSIDVERTAQASREPES